MRKHWPIILAIPGIAWRIMLVFNGEPLWYDEAFSVVVARLPFDRLIAATVGDVHPPLYYLLLKLWSVSAPWLSPEILPRCMSLFYSLIALVLFAVLLNRLMLSATERRIAWTLSAWLPSLTYFSAEARMYALFTVEILGALLCLWDSRRGGFWAELLRYGLGGVCIGLACLTHNVGFIYAPVIALSAALYHWRLGAPRGFIWPRLLITTGAAIIVVAPWLAGLAQQLAATTTGGYWVLPPSLGSVAYNVYMALVYTTREIQGLDAALMLIVGAVTTWGAVLQARENPEVVALPVGVIGLAFVASHVAGVGMLLHRLLLPLAFLLLVSWAAVIYRLRAVAVPVALICVLGNALYAPGRGRADYSVWQSVGMQPGDVVYANNSAAAPLLVYLPGVPIYVAQQAAPMATGLSPQTLAAIGAPMTRLEELDDWERAWYLFFDVPYTTEAERAYKKTLIQTFDGELVADLGGDQFQHGELWLLQNWPSGTHHYQN